MSLQDYLAITQEESPQQPNSEQAEFQLSLQGYLQASNSLSQKEVSSEENQAAPVGNGQEETHEASQASTAAQSQTETVPESDVDTTYGERDSTIEENETQDSDADDWWSFLFGGSDETDVEAIAEEPQQEKTEPQKSTVQAKKQASSQPAELGEPINPEPVSPPELPPLMQEALSNLLQTENASASETPDWTQAIPSEQIVEAIKVHQRLQQEAESLKQAAIPLIRMGLQLTDQDIQDVANLARERQIPIDIAMKAWGYEYLLRREMGIPIGQSTTTQLPQFPMTLSGNPIDGNANPSQEPRFVHYLQRLMSM